MPMINATIEDCHKFGLLHDAVAIVLFDRDDEILLILRSRNKFGGGKWELPATHCTGFGYFPDGWRCLEGEVGIKDIRFDCLGDFHYSCDVGDVKENEIVHVLIAEFDGLIRPNPEHCIAFLWVPLSAVLAGSESYAYWLHEGVVAMYGKVCEYINKRRGRVD